MSNTLSNYKYPIILVVLTLLTISAIELSHPYFFLQDDNRVLYLPFYVHNFKALLSGEFPLFNFHQFLGTPVTIQYAALYPINYISVGLSKLLFGDYFSAMEFIAAFHLLIATVGFFKLMRYFRLEEASCFFGAIAWTFCGFVITVGDSWIQTIGFAAYLPWILLFSIKLSRSFDIKIFCILVILKVLDMLLGYPQLFIYTMTFEFLTAILFFVLNRLPYSGSDKTSGAIVETADPPLSPLKFITIYIANYAAVFIITLPLVLQTMQQTNISAGRSQLLTWSEYSAFSYNLVYWLTGLVAPFKSADIVTQFELQNISHIGYLTFIFLVVTLISMILVMSGRYFRDSHYNVKGNCSERNTAYCLVFILLAIFSLLWAGDILVTKLFYHLPVYNRLRYPFKIAFFASFYLVMVSTFGFDIFYNYIRHLKKLSQRNVTLIVSGVLVLHVANFMVLYAALPQNMFSRHYDQVPFDEPLRQTLQGGRIVSASLDDVFDGEKIVPGFSAPVLGFNYATLWGVYHFGGYDPMVSEKTRSAALGIVNNPVFNLPPDEPFTIPQATFEYFRKWGVKWYSVSRKIPLNDDSRFKLIASDNYRNVLMDPLAKPLVYWQNENNDENLISYRFTTNSVEIDCSSSGGGSLIINVLYHPFFSAVADGVPLLITENSDNQMMLNIPKGTHKVTVRYSDSRFIYGSAISLAFLLLSLTFLLRRKKADSSRSDKSG